MANTENMEGRVESAVVTPERRTSTETTEDTTATEEQRGLTTREERGELVPGRGSTGPFQYLRRVMADLDRMFQQFGFSGLGTQETWVPDIEVFRKGNDLMVRADLPGMDSGDVRVAIDDDQLVIEGERRSSTEDRSGGVYRSERTYGRFHREIGLPPGIDADQVNASFDKGVLEISLPIREARERGRTIEVRSRPESSSSEPTVH